MVLFAVLGLAFLAAPSHAEGLDRNNEAALLFGTYGSSAKIQIDQKDNAGQGGGALGFRYLHNINPRVGLGAQLTLLGAGEHESTKLITNNISTTRLGTTDVVGVLRARFGEEHFRPYLLWGLGFHSTRLSLKTAPQAGLVWADTGTREVRTAIDDRKSGAAFVFEGGFDYHFNSRLSAGALLGWHLQSSKTYEATAAGRAMGISGVRGPFAGAMAAASLSARL